MEYPPSYPTFESLPKSIRIWLGSEGVTYAISEFRDAFGLLSGAQERLLPKAILYFAMGKIAPYNFSGVLQRAFSLREEDARSLTSAIYESIFRPIERELFDAGIDVRLLFSPPPSQKPLPPPPAPPLPPKPSPSLPRATASRPVAPPARRLSPFETSRPPAPLPQQTRVREQKIVSAPPSKLPIREIAPPAPASPFLLHRETSLEPVGNTPAFHLGPQTATRQMKEKPATAEIQLGPEKVEGEKPQEPQQIRTRILGQGTVHYDRPKTGLFNEIGKGSPSVSEENKIDLREE